MPRPWTVLRFNSLPPLLVPLLVPLLLTGCVPASERASWRIFPLPRHAPHDGLAVVTRPGGEGLHLYLDTDTATEGICRPRWNPDAARLRGGDGPRPSSTGLAPRAEFFAALGHGPLRLVLRQQFEALCRGRAPRREFVWVEPPRSPGDLRSAPLPLWEERDLLSNPTAVRRAEKRLLGVPLSPEDLVDRPLPRPPDGP
ncbi:hypothetical protein NZK32_03165 [Cyanobium sp. FGCU-52]|nr:hypothetical protein [Cyanobium sp. FGCU52]